MTLPSRKMTMGSSLAIVQVVLLSATRLEDSFLVSFIITIPFSGGSRLLIPENPLPVFDGGAPTKQLISSVPSERGVALTLLHTPPCRESPFYPGGGFASLRVFCPRAPFGKVDLSGREGVGACQLQRLCSSEGRLRLVHVQTFFGR